MRLKPIAPNAERSARIFGCSVEKAKKLFAQNADGFSKMADKAAKNGGKYNNYTEAELRLSAEQYAEAAR